MSGGWLLRANSFVVTRRPGWVLFVAIVFTALSAMSIFCNGRLSNDLRDLIPDDTPRAGAYLDTLESFGTADVLFVVLSGVSEEEKRILEELEEWLRELRRRPDAAVPDEIFDKLEEAVAQIVFETDPKEDLREGRPFFDALSKLLSQRTDLVRNVVFRIGKEEKQFLVKMAGERGYLLLPPEDIGQLRERFSTEGIRKAMQRDRKMFDADPTLFRKRCAPDPLDLLSLFAPSLKHEKSLFESTQDGYFVSKDGKSMVMIVRPTVPVQDLDFTRRFMGVVEKLEEEAWRSAEAGEGAKDGGLRERLRVYHCGGYPFALREKEILTKNIIKTVVMSFIGVTLLFAVSYRRVGAAFLIGAPLALSVLWTAGFAFAIFRRITIMSAGFGAILIGLGVDYGIHIYNRYVSERAAGLGVHEAVQTAIESTGAGIVCSAVTTALAFMAVVITKFDGLREFGMLTGIGVVMATFAMLFLLPAILVMRGGKGEREKYLHPVGFGLSLVSRVVARAPRLFLCTGALLCAAAATWVYLTTDISFFDSDFANLRSDENEVITDTRELEQSFGTNVCEYWVIAKGETEEEALELADRVRDNVEKLLEKGELAGVDSVLRYVPPPSSQRAVASAVASLDLRRIERDMAAASKEVGIKPKVFDEFLTGFRKVAESAASPPIITSAELADSPLGSLAKRYFAESKDGRKLVATYVRPAAGANPESWFEKIETGLEADGDRVTFVAPVQVSYEMRDLVHKDMTLIMLLVAAGVLISVTVHFRSVKRVIGALFPVFFGLTFLVATMRLIGHRFNYMNVLVLPAVVGIGIDNAIHMLSWRISGVGPERIIRETGRAMVVSTLTTMIGFGSLMFSSYRGLASLGFVSVVGLGFCLVTALFCLGGFLHLFMPLKEGSEEPSSLP